MPTYNEEITRLSTAVDEIKEKVKVVAENKGIEVENGVDTAITVLDKIDNLEPEVLGGNYDVYTEALDDNTNKLIIVEKAVEEKSQLAKLVDGTITEVSARDLEGTTKIKQYAFANCHGLSKITIPDSVTSIGGYGLYECKVTEINAKNVVDVGLSGFNNCRSLQKLKLLSCKRLQSNACYYCESLQEVEVPSCINVSDGVFASCFSLQKINLPLCKVISNSAFGGCRALHSLYINKYSILGPNVFRGTPMTDESLLGHYGSIYVPSWMVSQYKVSTNWAEVADRIVGYEPEGDLLQEIGTDVASGTTLTTTIDNCSVGDNLIACVVTRSDTTISDGWTLLDSAPIVDASNLKQRMSLYTKKATSATETITVNQTSSARIYANIVNIKNKTASIISSLNNLYTSKATLSKTTENDVLLFANVASVSTAIYDYTGNNYGFDISGEYESLYDYGANSRLILIKNYDNVTLSTTSVGVEFATLGVELV